MNQLSKKLNLLDEDKWVVLQYITRLLRQEPFGRESYNMDNTMTT